MLVPQQRLHVDAMDPVQPGRQRTHIVQAGPLVQPVGSRPEHRDDLLAHLIARGIEAKVHYPVPVYRQPALQRLGYAKGNFPVADYLADAMISLPAHEYVTDEQVAYMAATIAEFYQQNRMAS